MAEPVASTRANAVGRGLAMAALLLMLGNLLSRVLGLAREQLASGLFGTGDPIAAFQIADNVQTLLFDLAISGMLQAALVPVLVQWAGPERRRELRHVSGALLALTLIVVGGAVVAGMAFAPEIVRLMTRLGGDSARSAETTALTVTLVRTMLPAVLFLAVGTVLMAVLYALQAPAAPALGMAARNAVVVVAMLLLADRLGVRSMAWGVVAGGALVALVQLPSLARRGALPRLNLQFGQPEVRRVLQLYLPIFLGLLVSTAAVIVDRNLAWRAEADALGAMRYATTLVQFVLGLVAASISLASLPALASHSAAGDESAFRATLERALAMVTVLIVPATIGLAVLAVPVVDLLFRHGATSDSGAHLIAIALLGYLPGTLAAAYDQVLIYAFYARQRTLAPVLVGIAATGVYFGVVLSCHARFGMMGLVAANSAQFIIHLLLMVFLVRRIVLPGPWQRLRLLVGRCLVAGVVMGTAAIALARLGDAVLPEGGSSGGRLLIEATIALGPAVLGGLVYAGLLLRWRVEEALLLVSLGSRWLKPGSSK